MDKIKVIFVGGLTNGKIVHDYLVGNKYVELLASYTYADECTAPRFVRIEGQELIGRNGSLLGYMDMIKDLKPDLIMVAGWSELVPTELLSIAPMGVIGFHPAKLPHDRGRSVLAWQIEDGYKETALTMFKYTDYPDGGDIIAQEVIPIENNDYINDILDKVDKSTYNLMKAYFPLIRKGLAVAKKQDLSEGQFRRLRGEMDSWINWDTNSDVIYNKVRAISHPYPGAIANCGEEQIKVWRAEKIETLPFGQSATPGTLVARLYDNTLVVKTRDSFIRITDYTAIDNYE